MGGGESIKGNSCLMQVGDGPDRPLKACLLQGQGQGRTQRCLRGARLGFEAAPSTYTALHSLSQKNPGGWDGTGLPTWADAQVPPHPQLQSRGPPKVEILVPNAGSRLQPLTGRRTCPQSGSPVRPVGTCASLHQPRKGQAP